ncbi:MAG TPA: hypothetical protein VGQ39_23690 [Pyrinomonadaceae bacterium]|jgi:hypothetical protein|nr:hypothetical protein [Pyrinomonadaceae bacterium]
MKRHLMLFLALLIASGFNSGAVAQTKTREQLRDEIESKRSELIALEKQFLAVPEADRTAFADLLAEPNTGLIRLLPREIFDSETYKKNSKTITMRGGGAYYSFVRLTHEYGFGSDIELDHDQLSVGFAGYDYGMLLRIHDVSLQDLSAEYPYAAPLIRYSPPTYEEAIRNEQRAFSLGTVIDGLSLKRIVPVEVNATYLLRSISYRDSDILVGLKVIRRDSDGSVVLAWKLLKKFKAPEVDRRIVAR